VQEVACPGQLVLKISDDMWEEQAAGAFGHGPADEQSLERQVHRRAVERQSDGGYAVGNL
jgi:hypothetical protein